MTRRGRRAADLLAAGALACLALRLLLIVLAQPVLGYADNLDFLRDSACSGLWRAHDGASPFTAHWDGPVQRLVRTGEVFPELCLFSADHIFGWAIARLHPLGAAADLREVGGLKLAATLAASLVLLTRRMAPRSRAMVALALLLALGDTAVALYFNTLYADTALLAAAALALGFACATADRPGWGSVAGLAATLLVLGTVKAQGAMAAPVLGLPMALSLAGGRRPARAALVLLACLGGPLVFWAGNAGPPGSQAAQIARVNIWDTLGGAVLPAAADPEAALRRLGLPPACRAAIGVDFYAAARPAADAACPELARTSRLRLPLLFLTQPATFVRPLARAVDESRPAQLRLTPFADPADARHPPFVLLWASSLSTWLTWLPAALYTALLWAALVAGLLGWPWLAATALRGRAPGPPVTALALGAALCAVTLIGAVFGDGAVELNRHCAGLLVGLGFILAGALAASPVCDPRGSRLTAS